MIGHEHVASDKGAVFGCTLSEADKSTVSAVGSEQLRPLVVLRGGRIGVRHHVHEPADHLVADDLARGSRMLLSEKRPMATERYNPRASEPKWQKAWDAKKLFISTAALEQALGDRFCDALHRQRVARLKEAGEGDTDFALNPCAKFDELEILLGSSNRRTFNRLTLYAGPYVAGSYAEGAYEIDLPIDRKVLDAVKPEYRAAFSARN